MQHMLRAQIFDGDKRGVSSQNAGGLWVFSKPWIERWAWVCHVLQRQDDEELNATAGAAER